MEDQFLTEILKTTYTLESFRKRAMALKLIVEKEIFKSSDPEFQESEAQKAKSNLHQAREWTEGFDKGILGGINSENFRRVFETIDAYISGATTLTVYFVFVPEEAQIKEIGEWLRQSLKNPKLIFDIKTDPNLIGGCAIAYKGVYKDYSLKSKISANKEKLVEEFRRYLKN